DDDYITETFGIKKANNLNLNAPKLIAHGEIHDKYVFKYFIMEHINGTALSSLHEKLSSEEKVYVAKQLRIFTDKMDVKCDKFNKHQLFS
ncbi:hypothetical protein Q8G81_33765, partial [Klebsiella pneumoniae]